MIFLGARIPISSWTLVGLVVGTGLAMLCWRPLARRLAWWPAPTLVLLLSLTAILALTVTPDGGGSPIPLRVCVPRDPSALMHNALHTGGGLIADLLNGMLPVPFTAALTLASGRGRMALAIAILLPGVIEVTQTLLPGRHCAISDFLANAVGGTAGFGLGWVLRQLLPERPGSAGRPPPGQSIRRPPSRSPSES